MLKFSFLGFALLMPFSVFAESYACQYENPRFNGHSLEFTVANPDRFEVKFYMAPGVYDLKICPANAERYNERIYKFECENLNSSPEQFLTVQMDKNRLFGFAKIWQLDLFGRRQRLLSESNIQCVEK